MECMKQHLVLKTIFILKITIGDCAKTSGGWKNVQIAWFKMTAGYLISVRGNILNQTYNPTGIK